MGVSSGKRHLIHFKYKLIFIKTDKMRAFLSLVSVVGVTWALPQLQFGGPTDADTEAETFSGHVPGAPSVESAPTPSVQVTNEDQCCCIPVDLDCFDLVGGGRIDPKIVS